MIGSNSSPVELGIKVESTEIKLIPKKEVAVGLLKIKKEAYEILEPHKATVEDFPNVFAYGSENFENFDEISLFVLDDEAVKEFARIAKKIFYAKEFCQNNSVRGIFLPDLSAILVKRIGNTQGTDQGLQHEKSIAQITEEATIVHELAHASAKNITIKKVNPEENNGVEHKPMKIGLEKAASDKAQDTDDWLGMFLEEGFAQDHYGRYIAAHYSKQQAAALKSWGKGPFTFTDSEGQSKLVIYKKRMLEDGDYTKQHLAIDLDLVFLDGSRLMITPPSYAAAIYRELCQITPGFQQQVEKARHDPNQFDKFWQEIKQRFPQFFERFYHGRYFDPFNTDNSFKKIAFDFYEFKHKTEKIPQTKIHYIN